MGTRNTFFLLNWQVTLQGGLHTLKKTIRTCLWHGSKVGPFTLLLYLSLFPLTVYSQDYQRMGFDTVHVREGEDLIINNKVFRTKKDTIFYIPSSINYRVKRYKIGDDKSFYDSLEVKTENGTWLFRTLGNILLEKKKKDESNVRDASDLALYLENDNKIIKDIKIIRLDPFGTSVNDQVTEVNNWFEKAGNYLHIRTTERVIEKHLLFKRNERLDPYDLNDSERLLRRLSNIKDARILVQPAPEANDSVNVVVIARDVWSKAFGISTKNFSDGQFDFWDRNIFGLGHENKNGIFWDTQEDPKLGYKGEYILKNIGGSFVDWRSSYWDVFGAKLIRTELSREFFTPDIRYAGGLLLERGRLINDIWTRDSVYNEKNYAFSNVDVWFGRSFPILRFNAFEQLRSNLVVTARFQKESYMQRPADVSRNFLHRFHDKTRILAGIGWNSQNFKRRNLIYSFGRTEDIPFGYMLNLIGGYEYGEYKNRWYFGLTMAHAVDMPQDNYIYGKLSIGGFLREKKVEQGILKLESTYFTRLYRLRGFRFRYFANVNFTNGINPYQDEFTTINNGEGIKGLRSKQLLGSRKLVFNSEIVTFTPIYVFGFRLVVYGFGDIGFVGNHARLLINEDLYAGLGLGIRLRNERLTFNTIQLRLAFYPNIPDDATPEFIQFSGEPRLRPNNFFINEPSIIDYH